MRVGALELVRGAEALLVPVERLGVVALVLAQAALLQAQARERLRIGAQVIPSLLVGLARAGVVAAELEHVGEALPHPADLFGRERLHLGATSSARRKSSAASAFANFARARSAATSEKRHVSSGSSASEKWSESVSATSSSSTAVSRSDVGHARVQLAAAPEGQALVRRVADQRVAEVEGAGGVRVALDELSQPVPRLHVEGGVGVAFEHARDELAREAGAEHGRPAQQRPVARREAVDPAREHAFDALGQLLEPLLGAARGGDELLHEERVASRALGDRRELLGWQPFRAGGHRELVRVGLGQRVEAQRHGRHRRIPRGREEAALAGAARRADEPRLGRDPAAEVAEEVRGGLVHPVHVLDEEEGRRLEQLAEHRLDDAVQAGAPELGLEVVRLGSRVHRRVDDVGDERRPRHELGIDLLEPVGERDRVRVRIAVHLDVEQPSQELPEREVRRRRLVLLAAGAHERQPFGAIAELLEDPRLADACVADQLDEAAEAHAHGHERGVEHRQLALAVDERELLLRRGAARGCRRPRRPRPPRPALPFPFSVSAPTGSVAKAVRDRSRRSGVVQIERPSAFAIRRAARAAVPPRIVNACR